MVALAREKQVRAVFVPAPDALEASLMREVLIYPVENLAQLGAHLRGEKLIEPYTPDPSVLHIEDRALYPYDMADVKGQEHVKRALEEQMNMILEKMRRAGLVRP